MPARRSIRRRDWPRGLYETAPGYFIFRANGKQYTIGRVPVEFARDEALRANAALQNLKPSLAQQVLGIGHTVGDLVGEMPNSDRPNTTKTRKWADSRILQGLGASTVVANVTVADCAAVLEAEVKEGRARSAQALRSRMLALFRRAQGLGWRTDNPAEPTNVATPVVKRDRLVLDQFMCILVHAQEWLPVAMMLLLLTGQDRDTVVKMRRSHVQGNYLICQRAKTAATNQPVALSLDLRLDAVGLTLRQVLDRAGADYLVGHTNGAPVHPNLVTRKFTEARRAAGIPDVMPSGKLAPTYYEIKSLAKRLYKAQGNVDTKHLFSHRDDKTDALYADPRGVEPIFVDMRSN